MRVPSQGGRVAGDGGRETRGGTQGNIGGRDWPSDVREGRLEDLLDQPDVAVGLRQSVRVEGVRRDEGVEIDGAFYWHGGLLEGVRGELCRPLLAGPVADAADVERGCRLVVHCSTYVQGRHGRGRGQHGSRLGR